MGDLREYRAEIDRIDRELVRLFEERMEVSEQIGAYKIENGVKVFDKTRERQKLDEVKGLAHGDFNQHGVE